MARSLITPITLKRAAATSVAVNASGTARIIKIVTAGAYIKTTGINASKLILWIERTSGSTGKGVLTIVAGTTVTGTSETYTGACIGNLAIDITSSTGTSRTRKVIGPIETARFKDSAQYIKINFSSALTTQAAAAKGTYIAALLIP
jgi:hypothetical protein